MILPQTINADDFLVVIFPVIILQDLAARLRWLVVEPQLGPDCRPLLQGKRRCFEIGVSADKFMNYKPYQLLRNLYKRTPPLNADPTSCHSPSAALQRKIRLR